MPWTPDVMASSMDDAMGGPINVEQCVNAAGQRNKEAMQFYF